MAAATIGAMKPFAALRPGRFVDANGIERVVTPHVVAELAATYDPALHEAPMVIGHPRTDAPAYGWVASARVVEGTLELAPAQVEPAFADLVAAGRYKKRSVSYYLPDSPNNPAPGKHYIKHVGWLGAMPPAVKGLRDAELAGDDDAVVIELSEGGLPAWTLAGFMRRLREWLIESQGADTADRVVPAWIAEEAEAAAREPEDQPMASAFGDHPNTDTELPMPEDHTAALAEREAALSEREAALAAREASIAEAEAARQRAEVAEFAEQLVQQGRVLPRQRDGLVGVLAGLDAEATVYLADGDQEVPAGTWLRQFLAELPVRVDFSERAGGAGDEPAALSDKQIAAKARERVDQVRAEGGTLSFSEARDQVVAELTQE